MTDHVLKLPEFWAAVGGLFWPLVLLVALFVLRRPIAQLLRRDDVKLKVAGMEISVANAAEQAGAGVAELQERVAELERRLERGAPEAAQTKAAPPEPSEAAADRSRPFRILWVDDVPSNNGFLIARFRDEGYEVRTELDTRDGLKALEQDDPDVVITDLGREEAGRNNPMAGLDLIRAMRQAGMAQPVLVFAGARGLTQRSRLMQAGAEDVTAGSVDVIKFVKRHVEGR